VGSRGERGGCESGSKSEKWEGQGGGGREGVDLVFVEYRERSWWCLLVLDFGEGGK
jgi:hypothetical protein